MSLFLHYTPLWVQRTLFKGGICRLPAAEPTLYLTFDDGPIPVMTEHFLDLLGEYGAKATFFCVGDNVRKHPDIFRRLLAEGHTAGNHTYHHISGWKNSKKIYFDNVEKAQQIMLEVGGEAYAQQAAYFRPPYGAIWPEQWRALRAQGYQIVMWDVLSGDFAPNISPETCLQKSLRYSQNGSVIVFHDNIKAKRNVYYPLPKLLAYFSQKGYHFAAL